MDPANAPAVLVSILVAHQSKADPAMPLRTLLEATLHWTAQWRAWQEHHTKRAPLRLSPLLAIVFHTGDEAWKSHRRLADLIDAPQELQANVPSWEPLFWQVNRQPPDVLLQASGAWLRTLAVVRLADAPAAEFASVYEQVARSLEPLAGQDKMRWEDLMGFLLGWGQYRRRDMAEIVQLHAIAAASYQNIALREEIRTMSQRVQETWVDWAKAHYTAEGIALGEARGEALGEARGEARGLLRARREDLRLFLEDRFGPLPEDLIQRIEANENLASLHNALRQALHIQSLDELSL